jgi:hypothetical protein
MADKGKFCLTAQQVRSARDRWRKIINDCEWDTFDDYLQWMVESGWGKYMHLAKRNQALPHGPQNSIWLTPDKAYETEFYGKTPSVWNTYCDACPKKGTEECTEYGCAEWRQYFRENWNRNIYRAAPEKTTETKSCFCYSHPDDIREGRE